MINSIYPACPECKKKCNKSLSETSWNCEKCDKSYDNPDYTFIVPFSLADGIGERGRMFIN